MEWLITALIISLATNYLVFSAYLGLLEKQKIYDSLLSDMKKIFPNVVKFEKKYEKLLGKEKK